MRPYRDSDGNIIDRNLSYERGVTRSAAYSSAAGCSTAAFTATTKRVELLATTFCYFKLSTSSSTGDLAAATDTPLAPNDRIIVPVGKNTRISAIQFSAAGTIHATELP